MDDAHIFGKIYRYNKVEKQFIKAHTKEPFDVQLVEFSNRKYASMMPFKKEIFGKWTKK